MAPNKVVDFEMDATQTGLCAEASNYYKQQHVRVTWCQCTNKPINYIYFRLGFYVVHTLPMSDFCIYPHSGIPQGLKGLILEKNPLTLSLPHPVPGSRDPAPWPTTM
jgi:hypothetical protein